MVHVAYTVYHSNQHVLTLEWDCGYSCIPNDIYPAVMCFLHVPAEVDSKFLTCFDNRQDIYYDLIFAVVRIIEATIDAIVKTTFVEYHSSLQ